jgi:hypothetical protein
LRFASAFSSDRDRFCSWGNNGCPKTALWVTARNNGYQTLTALSTASLGPIVGAPTGPSSRFLELHPGVISRVASRALPQGSLQGSPKGKVGPYNIGALCTPPAIEHPPTGPLLTLLLRRSQAPVLSRLLHSILLPLGASFEEQLGGPQSLALETQGTPSPSPLQERKQTAVRAPGSFTGAHVAVMPWR